MTLRGLVGNAGRPECFSKLDMSYGKREIEAMNSRLLSHPLLRGAVRLLSFSALTVCLWLFGRKLSGDITSIAGCGGEGGCSQVLGGRWSEWFQVPVTLLAALVHATVLSLTLPPVQRWLGPAGDRCLPAAAVMLGGAAIYFLTLLYGVEHQHCPWCLGLHLTGITVAALILADAGRKLEWAGLGRPGLTGILALGVLAAGQIWGPKPKTYLLTGGTGPAAPALVVTGAGGREVSFLDGRLKYDTATLPLIGSPAAKYVMVEFFDYTCSSCRDLAGDLKELKKKWPETFAVIVLPAPLNRACNPSLKPAVRDHPGACELARLALALWKAKPEAFPEFHDFLLALPLPMTIERLAEARYKAVTLTSEEAIAAALEDPWVGQRLKDNVAAFAQLTAQSIAMPKLLLPQSGVMHGTAHDTAEFVRVMETQFKLAGPAPGAGAPAK